MQRSIPSVGLLLHSSAHRWEGRGPLCYLVPLVHPLPCGPPAQPLYQCGGPQAPSGSRHSHPHTLPHRHPTPCSYATLNADFASGGEGRGKGGGKGKGKREATPEEIEELEEENEREPAPAAGQGGAAAAAAAAAAAPKKKKAAKPKQPLPVG